MTFWYIRRVWKNMKNTSELYFNSYESTSFTPSLASASSGSRKYTKFSKCEFWIKEVPFLGHVVSPEGIAVDLGMVKEVLEWNPPTTVSEV
jgi:hypothetical protein